jgi:hypothetical protein
MALNRITGLGMVVLGSSLLLAVACDSGGTTVSPSNAGGSAANNTNAGGNASVGGHTGAGGTSSANTSAATCGTGGSSAASTVVIAATKAENCGTATAASGSFSIKTSNYFQLGDYAGYGFVYISPTGYVGSDGKKSITCDNSTFGSATTALCGAGTVPADPSSNSVGGIGFNLNQTTAGGTNSAKAITTKASTVTITFANTAVSGLHIQIVQNAAGTDTCGINYCYNAAGQSSPLVLNASDFTTTCWDSKNPGDIWDGTGAQSFQFVIPSNADNPTPFDACIENVVFG